VQALGAALIWLLCFMLNRVAVRPALTAWSNGWLSLAFALLALLIEQGVPSTAAVTLPMYMFGEYMFGWWIIQGCAHFSGRRWPRHSLRKIIPALVLVSLALPQVIGYQFRSVFLIQSLVLACCFLIALIALSPAFGRMPSSPGLLAMRGALVLLSLLFLSYLPIFGSNMLLNAPLPMTWLRLSSATHLVLEFLLGFGGAVLVLEQSHRNVSAHNQALANDNARYRAEGERDALTNAYHRHAFSHLLNTAIDGRMSVKGTVAMVDIDGLKQLNDSHGHAAGDHALIRVAKAVQNVARAEDKLFRWGGDEFLLIAFDLKPAELWSRLGSVNTDLLSTGNVMVQASFGVTEFVDVDDLLNALQRADLAMYERRRECAALRIQDAFGSGSEMPIRAKPKHTAAG